MAKRRTKSKKASGSKKPRKSIGKRSTSESSRGNEDIVQLILKDHKQLKQLIKILKDDEADVSERQDAFEQFAPLLIMHAKPEEQTMYEAMKEEDDLRAEGFEGEVEHQLADQLLEEAKRTDDEDLWCARVKVLAEIVEHHIREEESTLLPDFKKECQPEQREELAQEFLRLKSELAEQGGTDSPSEREMEYRPQH